METGLMNLHGDAPAGSSVDVVDGDGNLIGSTVADVHGSWSIESASLPVGQLTIKAIAKSKTGRVVNSPELTVDVESQCSSTRQKIDGVAPPSRICGDEETETYNYLVCAVAEGEQVDVATMRQIIQAANRSVEDFITDVENVQICNE